MSMLDLITRFGYERGREDTIEEVHEHYINDTPEEFIEWMFEQRYKGLKEQKND